MLCYKVQLMTLISGLTTLVAGAFSCATWFSLACGVCPVFMKTEAVKSW